MRSDPATSTQSKTIHCFIFSDLQKMANAEQSSMTDKEKAEWQQELHKEFKAAEKIFLPRKDAGETKVWTTGSQLEDFKIPKLTR